MSRGKHLQEDLKHVLKALRLESSFVELEEQTKVFINQQHRLSITDHFLLFFKTNLAPGFMSGKSGFQFASEELKNVRLVDVDEIFFDELEPFVLSLLEQEGG